MVITTLHPLCVMKLSNKAVPCVSDTLVPPGGGDNNNVDDDDEDDIDDKNQINKDRDQ